MSPYQTSSEGSAALGLAFGRAWGMFTPPPVLSLSDWADKYAFVPPEAGAFPGKFFTSSAEYQRGIQNAITDPNIETVVMVMCSQSGKTQIQLNTIGFYSHHEPCPMLFVQASEGEAEKFSKNRVAKMIRSTPVLRKIFPSPRARDSGNTLLNKEFMGGVLILAGANAPAGLASMPIRVLNADEIDRYPASAGTEGDPVDLAEKRQRPSGTARKFTRLRRASRTQAALRSWRTPATSGVTSFRVRTVARSKSSNGDASSTRSRPGGCSTTTTSASRVARSASARSMP